MNGRSSRMVSITALVLAVLALGLSAYAVSLGQRQQEEMRAIGQALHEALGRPSMEDLPMMPPPPELETD